MIDFKTFEKVEMGDIASIERAKKGRLYPKGSSTIQVSATKGQIGFLEEKSTIEPKYAVIIPCAGINMRYFNFIMERNVGWFMNHYCADINIQLDDLTHFPIELHNVETQEAVAMMIREIETKAQEGVKTISALQDLKGNMLSAMFV